MFQKKEEKRIPYTIERCDSCNKEEKRSFKIGDYVFKEISACSSCKGQIRISKIFGETIQKQ